MNFKKGLLLVDLETTGLDAEKHEIIQLAAVLLDKKTLKEKKSFNLYIRPRSWQSRDMESMKVNGIPWESLKNAASLSSVLRKFHKAFPPQKVILSYYGGPVDTDFLRRAYRQSGFKWQFDYHYFNLWALFYGLLAAKNRLKNQKRFAGFELEDLMKKFKIKSENRHDGLEDCRIEAEILRKIIKQV